MPADRSHVTGFEGQIAGELALHVEEPLNGVGRTPIELVGERLRRNDLRVGEAGRAIEPGLRGEVGIIVIPRAACSVAPDVETRVALVLVVEPTDSRPHRPFRIRTPSDSKTRAEVVVV